MFLKISRWYQARPATLLKRDFNTGVFLWNLRNFQGRRMSRRRLQYVFSVTIFCLPRRFEDLLQRRLEDVLRTSSLKACLEDVLKTCLEDVCKTSWRLTKCLLELSVTNKSKCASNKSAISNIYLTNPRGIENALIRTQ